MDNEKEILTTEDVATYLKITQEVVRRYLRSGKLKGTKLGRLWRIRKVHLYNLLNGNVQQTTNQNE